VIVSTRKSDNPPPRLRQQGRIIETADQVAQSLGRNGRVLGQFDHQTYAADLAPGDDHPVPRSDRTDQPCSHAIVKPRSDGHIQCDPGDDRFGPEVRIHFKVEAQSVVGQEEKSLINKSCG
jgi:hypothetical protein